jgi:hypothetical protein
VCQSGRLQRSVLYTGRHAGVRSNRGPNAAAVRQAGVRNPSSAPCPDSQDAARRPVGATALTQNFPALTRRSLFRI